MGELPVNGCSSCNTAVAWLERGKICGFRFFIFSAGIFHYGAFGYGMSFITLDGPYEFADLLY
jgi:hypothetical protein